ncbi:hypothetical protein E6R60_01660 [Streptomyces sp. A0642]|uniref:hypothetical protein n=1 Tax=Streptomyces sp. A0642 TaxID=2563100 RepID=UPI0010A266DD|nr:hypothetical protein [Streptomyces sp. A0642]THA79254.1 hypothetical protein E6R60_01660 [Streptomyces sp. A0642]
MPPFDRADTSASGTAFPAFSRPRFWGTASAVEPGAAILSACSEIRVRDHRQHAPDRRGLVEHPDHGAGRARAGLACEAAHLDAHITLVTLENDADKAKTTALTTSGKPPDIRPTRGGGALRQQTRADLVEDLTSSVSSLSDTFVPASAEPYQFDGQTYALPVELRASIHP